MRKLGLLTAAAALVAVTGTSVAAPAPKVDICHLAGNGSYHVINVSQRSLATHLAHGDGLPGGAMPGPGSFTGQGFFTSSGGLAEIEIEYSDATFDADCGVGPPSGSVSFDRSAAGSNYWIGIIEIAEGIDFSVPDSVSFTVRPTEDIGPNFVPAILSCLQDWTITSVGGAGTDTWALTDLFDMVEPAIVCAISGQTNGGTSTTGTFTIVPPLP